jgi:hypothetical protein
MESGTKNDAPPAKNGGGPAFHSRLEPFVEFIRELRQQRRTWKEIATRLGTEKGCPITFQGLHQFYRRYVKRQVRPHWEDSHKPEAVAPARPNEPASRPESGRKPILAVTPAPRTYRKPTPDSIELNDPTKP